MAKKLISDEEWMDIILTCRKSGLSDHRWCQENGVAQSTFYKYAKKLRMQGGRLSPIVPIPDCHQVVQVSLHEEESPCIEHNDLHVTDGPAISLHIHGIHMEIHNHADSRLLTNTLLALGDIC